MSLVTPAKIPAFLLANDEMTMRTREYDWNNHELGPIDQWPESLITSIAILLKNNFPMFLFWGEQSYCFYNNSYRPSLGEPDIGKHPDALAKPAKEVWPEIWHIIGPQIKQVMEGGDSTWHEDQLVPIYRNGAIEQVYWTYCYSAVIDKSGAIRGVMVTCIETTRKVQAEEKYKIESRRVEESEKRFRSLAENLPDMVSRHDIEGRFTYANPKVENYLSAGSDGFAGKSFKQLRWPGGAIRLFKEGIRNIFRDGKPISFHFQTPEGEHIYARLMPEFDQHHQVESVLFIGTDITELKKKEQKIEYSERRFRSTFENAAVGVAHVALDGTWLLTNDKLLSIIGYSERELVRLTFQEITHPDDLAKDLFNVEELLAGKISTYTMEKRYIHKHGHVIWVNLTVSLLRDENQTPLCFLSIIEDISARKKAEQDRLESENQLKQLSDFMPQIVWATEPNGDYYFFNQRWFDFSGLTLLETKNADWAKLFHPDDSERAQRAWIHSLQTGDLYETKFRMKRYDGQYRWLLARAMPFRNMDGVITRWFGTSTDIHEQKKTEEQLEILVSERTRDLQRSNEDLQQFAHVASHDLKEPLRKIRFFADKLTTLVKSGDHNHTVIYLEKIDRSVQRMFSMLNGVLEYASIDADPIVPENVDLNAVMRIIEFDLESLLKQKHADLQYHQLPSVSGVNILIQRVFFNLIYNSLKFAKADCAPVISVAASLVCNHIEANRQFDGEYCRIMVVDNGIGFSENDEEIIFGTFIRLHSKDTYEGAGLGLPVCRRILERLNGYIYAKGGAGKGATFIILLPAAKVFQSLPEIAG